MSSVTFEKATRRYPRSEKPAVNAMDLVAAPGEFLVLVGPSGCGKSTSLRMLAGLEPLDEGRILIGDEDVTALSPMDRDIAMVFQNYALYPHMTVAENMGFALKISGISKDERARRIAEAADMLDLTQYLTRKPKSLSGGQRQRVAMGRAIVRSPRVFLMDEPLSNLDAKLRLQTRTQIRGLQRRLDTTTVYVTHDQVEAMTMGDRVAVMNDGVLQQVDTPIALYDTPANVFVAGFLGSPGMNLLPGRAVAGGVEVAGQVLPIARGTLEGATTEELTVGIRPEGLRVVGSDGVAGLSAAVSVVEDLGSDAFVHTSVDVDGQPTSVVCRMPGRLHLPPGSPVTLSVDTEAVHVFDSATGRRLAA